MSIYFEYNGNKFKPVRAYPPTIFRNDQEVMDAIKLIWKAFPDNIEINITIAEKQFWNAFIDLIIEFNPKLPKNQRTINYFNKDFICLLEYFNPYCGGQNGPVTRIAKKVFLHQILRPEFGFQINKKGRKIKISKIKNFFNDTDFTNNEKSFALHLGKKLLQYNFENTNEAVIFSVARFDWCDWSNPFLEKIEGDLLSILNEISICKEISPERLRVLEIKLKNIRRINSIISRKTRPNLKKEYSELTSNFYWILARNEALMGIINIIYDSLGKEADIRKYIGRLKVISDENSNYSPSISPIITLFENYNESVYGLPRKIQTQANTNLIPYNISKQISNLTLRKFSILLIKVKKKHGQSSIQGKVLEELAQYVFGGYGFIVEHSLRTFTPFNKIQFEFDLILCKPPKIKCSFIPDNSPNNIITVECKNTKININKDISSHILKTWLMDFKVSIYFTAQEIPKEQYQTLIDVYNKSGIMIIPLSIKDVERVGYLGSKAIIKLLENKHLKLFGKSKGMDIKWHPNFHDLQLGYNN